MILKEAILEATLEAFNQKGLKFTMDQLAKELGISKKTLYTVFEDKESLLLEMLECCFDAIKASEQQIFEDQTLDIVEKIRRIIIVLPDKYRTLDFRQLYELEMKYPKIYEQVAKRLEDDWENTEALLREGIQLGCIRPIQIPILKVMISTAIESFIRTDLLLKEEIGYQEALEGMMDIVMKGLISEEV